MSTARTVTGSAANPTKIDIRKEVRFAVVLYGGVSLAVYIGGVVQELLSLVRATAPSTTDGNGLQSPIESEPTGSIAVYRRLAARLNAPGDAPGDTIYTRFVVDVISGTSAGGLNGLYLAKALARGQHIDHLRELWLSVGDIEKLMNGKDPQPRSVLNGNFMLKELHGAFEKMESQAVAPNAPNLVEDVQCFATTTDLLGLPVPIRLSDKTVFENRYRNVLRFSYSSGSWASPHTSFEKNDVALALAARSTSAFPAAFAPVALADAGHLGGAPDGKSWSEMYPDYRGTTATSADQGMDSVFDARQHGFADGGILNNKPFGHAISALGSRRGGKPSERRLIYVEPSPDFHFDIASTRNAAIESHARPNFFSVIQSAFSLPGEQTIHEDLERVLERNRIIDRMNAILGDIYSEITTFHARTVRELTRAAAAGDTTASRLLLIVQPRSSVETAQIFRELDVGDMQRLFGLGYGGYQRLSVAAATDDLTAMVTRLAGFDTRSSELEAISSLVRAWRDLTYKPYTHDEPPSEAARTANVVNAIGEDLSPALTPEQRRKASNRVLEARRTENEFVLQFDMEYRLRRLDFVLNKIDDLFCLDDRGILLLRSFDVPDPRRWMTEARRTALARMARELTGAYMMLRNRHDHIEDDAFDSAAWPTRHSSFKGVTYDRRRSKTQDLSALIRALNISPANLAELLSKSGSARDALAIQLVVKNLDAFDDLAAEVRERISDVTVAASQWSDRALAPNGGADAAIEPDSMLRFLYQNYQAIDRITFPVFFETDIGQEIDTVGVVRVSPHDSTSIVKTSSENPPRRLGGESLGHFGGFFSAEWRARDFLWGQLDGAERLITAICLGYDDLSEKERDEFIREAQIEILRDNRNVAGIPELERETDPEKRMQWLKDNSAVTMPAAVNETIGQTVKDAAPILEKIFASGGTGLLGSAAPILGKPALMVVESLFEPRKKLLVLGVSIGAIIVGILGTLYPAISLTPPTWLPGARKVGGFSQILGALILVGVGFGTLFVRWKVRVAFDNLISPKAPTEG